MARRYYLACLPPPGPFVLPDEVCHHLGRVMRCRVGDPVVFFDGDGQECRSRVLEVGPRSARHRITVEVTAIVPADREPETAVHVAFAAPKGSRSEWLFEHGTEVGIHTFHPVATERAEGAAARRHDRWRRILQAATGQCDRGRIPDLRETRPLADFLSGTDLPSERYLAAGDAPPLGPAATAAAVVLVGPEGGLSTDECAAATGAGFVARSLGVTTLRTETAVLAAAVRLLQRG